MTPDRRRFAPLRASSLVIALSLGAIAISPAHGSESPSGSELPPELEIPVKQLARVYFGIPEIDDTLHAADLQAHAGDTAAALEGYRRALTLIRSYPNTTALARADTLAMYGRLLEKIQDLAGAIDAYGEGAADLQNEKNVEPHRVPLDSALANVYLKRGQAAEAEDPARGAYEGALAYYGVTDPITVGSDALLVESLYNQKKYAQTIPQAMEFLRTATIAFGGEHWLVARAATFLGLSESALARRPESVVDLGHALSLWSNNTNAFAADRATVRARLEAEIARLELSPDDSATTDLQQAFNRCAQAQYVLASALSGTALGRRQLMHQHDAEAEVAYQRTSPWAEQLDPRADRTLLYVLNGLGIAEYDQKKLDSAENHFRRGLQLAREEGKPTPVLGAYLDYMSRVLASQGRYSEAFPYAQEMVAVFEQLPISPITRAVQFEDAAVIYIAGQNRAKGFELLQHALRLQEQVGGPGSAETAATAYWIALEAALLDDRKTAEQYAKRALDAQLQCCGHSPSGISDDELLLGLLLSAAGSGTDARVQHLFHHALNIREAGGTPDIQAELYRALFLQSRHHPKEAQALLDRIPAWPDELQDEFTFTSLADLQHHEVFQYWKHEALRYCAALAVTDPQPPLCQKISPKLSAR